jgi:hypothetical protein
MYSTTTYRIKKDILHRKSPHLHRDAIEFRDALRGFRGGRGTGTAAIELKLLMQHTRNCGVENVYIIFLDLKKAYFVLAGSRQDNGVAVLKGYGVGRNLLAFIKRISGYWTETRWYRSKEASLGSRLM